MRNVAFRQVGGMAVFAAAAGVAATAAFAPAPVQACGGLFCSAASPVNQAAEQIVFADNGDGTVTAIIQIMYEGPAHEFAWVLPVPGVPDVGVSSEQALDVLKQATNPVYQLQTSSSGSCGGRSGQLASFGNESAADAGSAPPTAPGVTVEASGAIGPYEYDVISFDAQLDDPADAAIEWLTQNAYEVGELGPEVLRPYLQERMNLIAFKLQKGNDAGSIRPVMITYESALPSIPIRPTAVAANDDMGVLVWVLAEKRAVPENYKALVLNEALLDWFNPMNNYAEVVTRAADEAMGHGFVTEYAGRHAELGVAVFSEVQQDQWDDFMQREFPDAASMAQEAMAAWGNFDGFDDALHAAVTLPESLAYEDFKRCLRCYADRQDVSLDEATFLQKLFEMVIKPLIDTQALLDARPYMTRLYTTLSAHEMTLDPAFAQNPDLDGVSNVHVADQIFDCDGGFRVELPQGDVVRGFQTGVWPVEVDDAPAALKILQLGTAGQGRLVEDHTGMVERMIRTRNQLTTAQARDAGLIEADGGCSAAGGTPSGALPWLVLSVAALLRRRRSGQH